MPSLGQQQSMLRHSPVDALMVQHLLTLRTSFSIEQRAGAALAMAGQLGNMAPQCSLAISARAAANSEAGTTASPALMATTAPSQSSRRQVNIKLADTRS